MGTTSDTRRLEQFKLSLKALDKAITVSARRAQRLADAFGRTVPQEDWPTPRAGKAKPTAQAASTLLRQSGSR